MTDGAEVVGFELILSMPGCRQASVNKDSGDCSLLPTPFIQICFLTPKALSASFPLG